MKAKSKLTLTAIIWQLASGIAGAQDKPAHRTEAWLGQKLEQTKQLDNGVKVNFVDRKYVEEALKKVGGKATIDFGADQKLRINDSQSRPQSSKGGVLIGSGADGLIGTSSADQIGPIVIQPPVIPNTSLTIVGRWGKSQGDIDLCVARYATDNQGQLKKSGSVYIPSLNACTKINKPMRVAEGFYGIFFRSGRSESPQYFVRVRQGENVVIPLREISVPEYNQKDTKIFFKVKYNNASPDALMRSAIDIFYRCSPDKTVMNEAKIVCRLQYALPISIFDKELYSFLNSVRQPDDIAKALLPNSRLRELAAEIESHRENPTYYANEYDFAIDGSFVSVFPGTYDIEWLIDGQIEQPTQDVVVE